MHPQTLRKYERAGLLHPARREGGSRHYSADDLSRLALIKHLAEVRRINVAGMALVLSIHDEIAALSADVAREGGLDATVLQRRLEAIAHLIANGSEP